jgi:hypothetical protein
MAEVPAELKGHVFPQTNLERIRGWSVLKEELVPVVLRRWPRVSLAVKLPGCRDRGSLSRGDHHASDTP